MLADGIEESLTQLVTGALVEAVRIVHLVQCGAGFVTQCQHLLAGEGRENPGDDQPGLILVEDLKMLQVVGFLPVIQFLMELIANFPEYRIQCRFIHFQQTAQAQNAAQVLHVRVDGFLDCRVLHFYHHLGAVRGQRVVHLANGGRGKGLFIEPGE